MLCCGLGNCYCKTQPMSLWRELTRRALIYFGDLPLLGRANLDVLDHSRSSPWVNLVVVLPSLRYCLPILECAEVLVTILSDRWRFGCEEDSSSLAEWSIHQRRNTQLTSARVRGVITCSTSIDVRRRYTRTTTAMSHPRATCCSLFSC